MRPGIDPKVRRDGRHADLQRDEDANAKPRAALSSTARMTESSGIQWLIQHQASRRCLFIRVVSR